MSEPHTPHASHEDHRLRRREAARLRRRHRMIQAIAILPSLATVLNGLSGFGAIYFATYEKVGTGGEWALRSLTIACGLVFLSMFFDMLDGGLARMTKKTSEFGAELDSLSDVISFGVAPAVIAMRAIFMIAPDAQMLPSLEPIVWCVCAIFVACAALRLARFNVETSPELSAHMSFRGLPSPGAAATVVSLVLLYTHMQRQNYLPQDWMQLTAAIFLATMTGLCALLMVSRFRYPHAVNRFIRGRRPLNYLVKLIVVVMLAIVGQLYVLAAATVIFALWGPTVWLYRLARPVAAPGTPAGSAPPRQVQ